MNLGNSRRQTLAVVALVVGMGLASTLAEAQEELKDLARRAKSSVVLLEVLSSGGRILGSGTGFFVEQDVVVTNHHVVASASTVRVRLDDRRVVAVQEVMAEDADSDLALLRVEGSGAEPLPLYRGGRVEPGEEVVVLGNPEGLSGTLSTGIVSALRTDSSDLAWSSIPLLQITAPISPGSSGSPVMNRRGEVLGVAVAVHRTGQNLNFAVPVEEVRRLKAIAGPHTVRELREASGPGTVWMRNLAISALVFAGLAFFIRRP